MNDEHAQMVQIQDLSRIAAELGEDLAAALTVNKRLTETKCMEWNIHEHTALRRRVDRLESGEKLLAEDARIVTVKLSDAQAALAESQALAQQLEQEAQIHAQEARTANATIAEIYQLCTGATGEPGNWHGTEPVRAALAAKDAEIAELRLALDASGIEDMRNEIVFQLNQRNVQAERIAALTAERDALKVDAERYRLLRRGQHWSVIDGIGEALRAEALDAAINSAIAKEAAK